MSTFLTLANLKTFNESSLINTLRRDYIVDPKQKPFKETKSYKLKNSIVYIGVDLTFIDTIKVAPNKVYIKVVEIQSNLGKKVTIKTTCIKYSMLEGTSQYYIYDFDTKVSIKTKQEVLKLYPLL